MNRALRILVRIAGSIAVLILFLIGWQLAVQYKFVDPIFVSTPAAVYASLVSLVQQREIWLMAGVTYYEILMGFIIGAASGISIGFMFYYLRTVYEWFQPYILVFYSIPVIVFAPLFILFFGIGVDSKIAIAFWGVFFVFLLNTFQALQNVDGSIVDATRVMGARRFDIFRKVTLPYIMPWMTAAMKLGMGFAFIGAIVGEFIGSPTNGGIGWYIDQQILLFNSAPMLAAIAVLAGLIMATTYALVGVEKVVVRWNPSKR